MKKIAITFIPIMLAGFNIPGEHSGNPYPAMAKYDGPYVLYKNEHVFVKYIVDDQGTKKVQADSMPLSGKSGISLQVGTDEPDKTFTVQLKQEMNNEATEFAAPSKMFILSDIEGNFGAFRKLLQAGGVIDGAYNWTFGNGHLVLTGDFVDRGKQVTEVLWLIYSLEDKARAAGGHVHYILGNHEIMNLSGDLRYVDPKYMSNAALLNLHFTALYGEETELGRWLRTKNVVEKIGDILFTHGGFSAYVNRMAIPADTINHLARPYYADSLYVYGDKRIDVLYSDFGPFWYRGYYKGNPAIETAVIDSTLDFYKAKYVATGHTVVADTISVLYNGKVFNTDVHHARGHSEAILQENGKFFRVSQEGKRFLLL